MTEQEAQHLVAGKLVFGDENQIRARDFLRCVAECEEELRAAGRGPQRQWVINKWCWVSDNIVDAAYLRIHGHRYFTRDDDSEEE